MPRKKKCKATIVFGDDFGDNCTTFHCRLIEGHPGPHCEASDMGYDVIKMPYTLTWEGSDKELNKAMREKRKDEISNL